MGAELLGTVGTTTVGGVATTSYTTAALVANAAFTSLASQAGITLINNKGDVGKMLKALGSSTVKATLAAALTPAQAYSGCVTSLKSGSSGKDLMA